jgi:recombinational DNA repair protein (RecF pathway)
MGSYLEGNRLPPPYEPKSCCLCGKSQDDARRMVAVTPLADQFLCDECITLMHELVTED